MANLIWLSAMLVALVLVIVVPRVAWYVLMSYRQRLHYQRELQLAASQGMPPPAPPSPPNVWEVTYRINRIAVVLGLAGALIAVVALVISGHR
jgi:hypothetical protein